MMRADAQHRCSARPRGWPARSRGGIDAGGAAAGVIAWQAALRRLLHVRLLRRNGIASFASHGAASPAGTETKPTAGINAPGAMHGIVSIARIRSRAGRRRLPMGATRRHHDEGKCWPRTAIAAAWPDSIFSMTSTLFDDANFSCRALIGDHTLSYHHRDCASLLQ